MIFDRDAKFDAEVIAFLEATGLKAKRTSVQSPWQNGIAERWIGSCRREILDHVIALNERHLQRLIRDYVNYHHKTGFRIHLIRTHRIDDPWKVNLRQPQLYSPLPGSADFIIGTAGAMRHRRPRLPFSKAVSKAVRCDMNPRGRVLHAADFMAACGSVGAERIVI